MLLQRIPETERVQFGKYLLVGRDELTRQPVLQTNGTDATLSFIQRGSWDSGGPDVFSEADVKRMEETLDRFIRVK